MHSTWYVNIYIYSSSCTVHGMLIFTFTAVHVQYMVCLMFTFTAVHVQYMVHYFLHLQKFVYSTWYVNVYIYNSSRTVHGMFNVYIYSSSCTVHGMLIFTFTAVHVQYKVC
jgi:hypothetical protein